MNTTQNEFETLTASVVVLENNGAGGVIAGHPAILERICAKLGFRNSCSDGRVFLTGPKMARVGLASAKSMVPDWRNMSSFGIATVVEALLS